MVFNKKIIASMIVASLGAVALSSANAALRTATGTAVIAAAITIAAPTTNLSFGVLSDSGAGGSATVDGTGLISGVTGATTSTGGTASAAQFVIGGTGTLAYTVDLTASSATLTGPGTAMPISYVSYSFNDSPTYAAFYTAPNALVAGADTLRVGGTLTVGAAQTAGTYTGTVSVTVLYN